MLIILIGPSGSGKSTYVNKKAEDNSIILSSDSIRGIIGANESSQTKNNIVFSWLRIATHYFLQRNKIVYLDTTAINKESRKKFIDIAKKLDAQVVAVVLFTSIEDCKKRNLLRARQVPENVIDKQFNKYQPPTLEEGFSEIKYVNS